MVVTAEAPESFFAPTAEVVLAVALAASQGLLGSPKSLPPWLFYDEHGSALFEQITALAEYYPTRTERALFETHAEAIRQALSVPVTVVELGAGSATKTGVLLRVLAAAQDRLLYQPIDVSPSALAAAQVNLEGHVPGLTVRPLIANYITETFSIERRPQQAVLALYIGSSIGNFSPEEARSILRGLREKLLPGSDHLLLGVDLAPSAAKPVSRLLAAYDDAGGVTGEFNRNVLGRLNRELGTDFNLAGFRHVARWNAAESRIEMHLQSLREQTVRVPSNRLAPAWAIHLAADETIHTENSYKFTRESVGSLLRETGFAPVQEFRDPAELYTLGLAQAV